MRIRSIKPEFWRSKDVAALEWESRLLFIGLWSYVDDNGVGEDRISLICADLFADDLERDLEAGTSETLARVSRGLRDICDQGLIARYKGRDGRDYLYVTGWEHQRIDRPAKPRYPLPTSTLETVAKPSRDPRETLAAGTGEQGNRGTGEQESLPHSNDDDADAEPAPQRRNARRTTEPAAKGKRGARLDPQFVPDLVSRRRILEKYPNLDLAEEHEKFIDYWTAQPSGKGVKADWDATWRNWMRRAGDDLARRAPAARQRQTDDMFAGAARRLGVDGQEAIL